VTNPEKQLNYQQPDPYKNLKYQINALLRRNVKRMQKPSAISSLKKIHADF